MPEGCPERPGTEMDSENEAKAVCISGHPRAGGASCMLGECSGPPHLLPSAAPPSCCVSTSLGEIIQSSGREQQGQLIWVTTMPEKERRGKKNPLLFPNLSSHGCPDSCPCIGKVMAWDKGRL